MIWEGSAGDRDDHAGKLFHAFHHHLQKHNKNKNKTNNLKISSGDEHTGGHQTLGSNGYKLLTQ